jgi:hypothetical protein
MLPVDGKVERAPYIDPIEWRLPRVQEHVQSVRGLLDVKLIREARAKLRERCRRNPIEHHVRPVVAHRLDLTCVRDAELDVDDVRVAVGLRRGSPERPPAIG